ncbi:hypothetical protein [Kordiimonas sp.]|uniref:hypothetical protein n=1 Tax=Kordiimonas sp. TaxID=1970157 RepID=UPI003A94FC40
MTHPKTLIASLAMLSASVGVQAEGSSYEEITRYISAQCMNVNMGDEPQVTSIDFNQTQVLVRKKNDQFDLPGFGTDSFDLRDVTINLGRRLISFQPDTH